MAKGSEVEKLQDWFSGQAFEKQKEVLEALEGIHREAVEVERRSLMEKLAALGGVPATPKRKGPAKGGCGGKVS